jgi:hypothetical protein
MRRSPIQRRRPAVLLLALALSGGCHRAAEDSDRTPAPDAAETNEVPLEVANHHWLDVTIYVVRDGQPARVGIANASSSTSFVLPSQMLGQGGEIRLLAGRSAASAAPRARPSWSSPGSGSNGRWRAI